MVYNCHVDPFYMKFDAADMEEEVLHFIVIGTKEGRELDMAF